MGSQSQTWLSDLHLTSLVYIHFYLFIFLRFCLIPLFRIYSSITFFFFLPNSLSFFYVWYKCVTFPDLEKWSYTGDNLWGPASDPTLGCIGPSFVAGPTIVGVLIGSDDSQPSWLPDSWLVWLLLGSSVTGCVVRSSWDLCWLANEQVIS